MKRALVSLVFLLAIWTDIQAKEVELCWDYPTTYTSGSPMDLDDVFKVRIWHKPWGTAPNPAWKGHLGETKAPDNCFTTKDFPDWLYACFEVEMVMDSGKESELSEALCLIVGDL
tara:strand:- start:56 stop:400 length:345 start_codon:yes stop_codon:yes gene_type:complete